MTDRQKWLIRQPTFWLGILATALTMAVTVQLVKGDTLAGQIVGGILGLLQAYGITAGHYADPPRIPLAEMSAADREKVFANNPGVRERFYLEHPEFLPATPPPLPPPPTTTEVTKP